jgi:hypothetical protein
VEALLVVGVFGERVSAESADEGSGEEGTVWASPDGIPADEEDEGAEDAKDGPGYVWRVSKR